MTTKIDQLLEQYLGIPETIEFLGTHYSLSEDEKQQLEKLYINQLPEHSLLYFHKIEECFPISKQGLEQALKLNLAPHTLFVLLSRFLLLNQDKLNQIISEDELLEIIDKCQLSTVSEPYINKLYKWLPVSYKRVWDILLDHITVFDSSQIQILIKYLTVYPDEFVNLMFKIPPNLLTRLPIKCWYKKLNEQYFIHWYDYARSRHDLIKLMDYLFCATINDLQLIIDLLTQKAKDKKLSSEEVQVKEYVLSYIIPNLKLENK